MHLYLYLYLYLYVYLYLYLYLYRLGLRDCLASRTVRILSSLEVLEVNHHGPAHSHLAESVFELQDSTVCPCGRQVILDTALAACCGCDLCHKYIFCICMSTLPS